MDIFGGAWENHHLKLKENWEGIVGEDDTVILGGDLSWAMRLEDATLDFQFVDALPGNKVLFKGNHDYWWQSFSKVKAALPKSMVPVQNNYVPYSGDVALCGTRGWTISSGPGCAEVDKKIYKRELIRLELSLESARKDGFSRFIVTLHYPPFSYPLENSGFTEIMQRYGVNICLYGHLHGRDDHSRTFSGTRNGIRYYFISGDFLNFSPLRICPPQK